MKALMFRLWNEDCAAIIAAELLLIATILVLGVVVGLAAVRDSVVTELADVAQALANMNQSFSFSGTAGHHAFSAGGGSSFHDSADFCDRIDADDSGNSKCVTICANGATAECEGNGNGGGGGRRGKGHGK